MPEQDVHHFTMTLSYCSDQSCLSKVILCETRQLIYRVQSLQMHTLNSETKFEVTDSLRMKDVEAV